MNIIKIVSGVLFFDNFSSNELNPELTLIPNNSLRYSLVERLGYLKLYHGDPNLFLLLDEPAKKYIIDIRNEYVPSSSSIQAGIVVFKTLDNSLELLEYYDENKDAGIVYEYLRIERSNDVYTGYGKNHLDDEWELIGATEFNSAGKVGVVLKGYNSSSSSSMDLDFIRVYTGHDIKLVNVPLNYTVALCEPSGNSIQVRKVNNSYNGITFTLDKVFPISAKFQIFDELNHLIKTSSVFEIVGGDVFYYGAYPIVTVNGQSVLMEECFLGYFTDDKIEFIVTLENPYEADLLNVVISPVRYQTDEGYKFITFSDSINGVFETELILETIPSQTTTTIYGKVTRGLDLIPLSTVPFKFNLGITFI